MHLHYLCTGNVFRSRLAESYTNYLIKTKNISDLSVSSSGVLASSNEYGPLAWFAKEVLNQNNLLAYASPAWIQTSPEILKSPDLIIFMTPYHLQFCQTHFGFSGTNYQIWHIEDIDSFTPNPVTFTQDTFTLIKSKVDQLLSNLPLK